MLRPGDPPPFEILNRDGACRAVLICDHASRAVPSALDALGLDGAALSRHIAWDIGIEDVTRRLAKRLDAAAILSGYSRLVIDCNRRLGDPTSIAQESDGVVVPGNRGLGPQERAARVESCFHPYHAAISSVLDGRFRARLASALVSMHSFTPVMAGLERPWHVGILSSRDRRLAQPLLARLRAEADLRVGDNQPYSGRDERGYSIHVHGEDRGLPYALIELRQDLIDTHHGAEAWADRLAGILPGILADERLYGEPAG